MTRDEQLRDMQEHWLERIDFWIKDLEDDYALLVDDLKHLRLFVKDCL